MDTLGIPSILGESGTVGPMHVGTRTLHKWNVWPVLRQTDVMKLWLADGQTPRHTGAVEPGYTCTWSDYAGVTGWSSAQPVGSDPVRFN
jgi:hypothetical protein